MVSRFQAAAESDAVFAEVRNCLRAYQTRHGPILPELAGELAQIKADAVAANDQAVAGAAWCFERIAETHDQYLNAWQMMSEDRFYGAWCALERVEIGLHFLARHFDDSQDNYGLTFLRTHVPRWQSLFPSKLFLSPGFTKQSVRCTICDSKLTPRRLCEHRLGHLYDGEMCMHRVDKAHFIEISLVPNPVQKYSVAFPKGLPYNYVAVHYVASGLRSPWHRWQPYRSTRRQPDPKYASTGRNDLCPCGSNRKFKKCHASDPSYDMPHIEIKFLDGMRAGLPAERIGQAHYGIDDRGGVPDTP
jgi:hypothetical protein